MKTTGKSLILSIIIHLILVSILGVYFHRRTYQEGMTEGISVELNLKLERPRVKRMVSPRVIKPVIADIRPTSQMKPLVRPSAPLRVTTAVEFSGPDEGFDVAPELGGITGRGLNEPRTGFSTPSSIPSYSIIRKPKLLRFVGGLGGRRRVVYCLDISASMSSGFDKLSMAKAYLRQSLSDLSKDDIFNLIAFHDKAIRFRDELIPATRENVNLASEFMGQFTAASIRGNDKTDLFAPLVTALSMRPDLIVLVTDGLPSAGILDPVELARRFKKLNVIGARIYAIGMGLEEKSPGAFMLRKLAMENGGDFELIRR